MEENATEPIFDRGKSKGTRYMEGGGNKNNKGGRDSNSNSNSYDGGATGDGGDLERDLPIYKPPFSCTPSYFTWKIRHSKHILFCFLFLIDKKE